MTSIAPFLIFFLGAALALVTGGILRSAIMLAVPLLGGLNLLLLADGNAAQIHLFDYTLTLVRVDKLSFLFGILFHLAAFLAILFSLHVKDRMQNVSGLVYAGSALGAVFAGDLLSLFVFWEILAVSSAFLVLAARSATSYGATMRYLLFQILSGVVLLAGVLVYAHQTGSIAFGKMALDGLGPWLIFLAIGIKCGFPLLHNWLTDAYPQSTPTGAVFLSAFTTKVAVYALARSFAGTEILIYIGAAMTMFPIFFAVIENDLRRVLSYSMINQIGFMVCGIGLGSALAVNGAVSHAFNDVIFKGLLFMSMGAVMLRTGTTKASELGGLYKSMPWTTGFCIVGAASISAFPLFSGFVSKSMVMVAALEDGHPIIWLALLFASAGVLEHAGIKIPFFAFFAHDAGHRVPEAPKNMLIAMGIAAVVCIFNGTYPWVLYSLLPFPVDYAPYTSDHVLTQVQLLLFASLGVAVLMQTRLYPPEVPGVNIDAEWSYRKALPAVARWVARASGRVRWAALARAEKGIERFLGQIHKHHGPQGILARTWPTGSMAFWATVLLAIYLVAYYV
ncbi:MAG: Na(+)/H(+) antiporter subunit D [Rhodobiaceae bacterium]|nr:Na(+)/H(+) antiporter subunit D [Rhodobiaceae bacterium]